jgi:hypothetical protein
MRAKEGVSERASGLWLPARVDNSEADQRLAFSRGGKIQRRKKETSFGEAVVTAES